MPLIYAFDHPHETAPMGLKDLLGGKGANLAEMTSVLHLPVPPGFTITTEACRPASRSGGWPSALDDEIAEHMSRVEQAMGRRLGDPDDPLLVSVRSGAKFSMPGMMDTVLNLGLNDDSVEGLAAQTGNERFALRFLPPVHGHVRADRPRCRRRRVRPPARGRKAPGRGDRRTPRSRPSCCATWCDAYQQVVAAETGEPFPQDPGRAAADGGRGRVPLVERRPGRRLPRPASTSPTTWARR